MPVFKDKYNNEILLKADDSERGSIYNKKNSHFSKRNSKEIN